METNEKTYDFDKITSVLLSRSENIENLLETCKTDTNLPTLKEYIERSRNELTIKNQKQKATKSEIAEIFQVLNTYPKGWQKPKKLNSTTSRLNLSKKNESNNSSKLSLVEQLYPAPKDLYGDILKAKIALLDITKNMSQKSEDIQRYKNNISSLKRSLDDLQKIIPDSEKIVNLFTAEEEADIKELRENIDSIIYMKENQVVYPADGMFWDPDLQIISKMLSDILLEIS